MARDEARCGIADATGTGRDLAFPARNGTAAATRGETRCEIADTTGTGRDLAASRPVGTQRKNDAVAGDGPHREHATATRGETQPTAAHGTGSRDLRAPTGRAPKPKPHPTRGSTSPGSAGNARTTGRISLLRKLALAALTLATLAACGIRPTDPIPGLPAPRGPVEQNAPSLFWVLQGALVPVSRPQGSLSTYDVVPLLAQGPNESERARGFSTAVPFDAAPATVDRVENGFDVELSTDVSQLSRIGVQQIVCTLLGLQPVGTVNLRGGGHSLEFQRCG